MTEHPPVKVTIYLKLPDKEGVPLIVTKLFNQLAETPVGKPVTVAPVAPVVLYVIKVIGVFTQIVCEMVEAEELRVMVLIGFTLIVPVAVTVEHPPVRFTV